MEVKLSHTTYLYLPIPTSTTFSSHSKRGETLTSISKQYGVSINSIAAANKNIVDVDLVFKGQQLNIPTPALGYTQAYQTKKNRLAGFDLQERQKGLMNFLDGFSNQKIFTTLTSHSLPPAKTTGYFLVLVPLIAFCIRCIIGAFHTRVARESGQQGVNELMGHHHGSRNKRWRCALSDIREPDNLDSVSTEDSISPSEGQAQVSFEEVPHAYKKLEHDYQKFLSECGMSKWGY